MSRSAKTISVGELQAAVKTALEATRKTHPEAHFQSAANGGGEALLYLPYWLCGGPFLPPGVDLGKAAQFAETFTGNLSKSPVATSLALDGKIESAVYVTGGKVSVGFVPGEASLTE